MAPEPHEPELSDSQGGTADRPAERLIVARDAYYRPTRARELRRAASRHHVCVRVFEQRVPGPMAAACISATIAGLWLLGTMVPTILGGVGLLSCAVGIASVTAWTRASHLFQRTRQQAHELEREHRSRYGGDEAA